MTYGRDYGWAVLAAITLAGVMIRQFFVLRHSGSVKVWLPAVGTAMLIALAVVIAPVSSPAPETVANLATGKAGAGDVGFTQVQVHSIIEQRCNSRHSARPTDKPFALAPAGVMFDTVKQINALAPRIHEHAIVNKTMPLGNHTNMTDRERAIVAAW